MRAALGRGNKIEAIRLYRVLTGVSLRQAKDAVEALERGLPVRTSATVSQVTRSAPHLQGGTGCRRCGTPLSIWQRLSGGLCADCKRTAR